MLLRVFQNEQKNFVFHWISTETFKTNAVLNQSKTKFHGEKFIFQKKNNAMLHSDMLPRSLHFSDLKS